MNLLQYVTKRCFFVVVILEGGGLLHYWLIRNILQSIIYIFWAEQEFVWISVAL